MKKKMISATVLLLIGLLVSAVVYRLIGSGFFFSLAITFGTAFYHFAVRLAVGLSIDAKYHNRMDYTKPWFQEKSFEPKLYQKLQVKKWKKYLPTFTPEEFDLKSRSVEQVVQAMCQSEVVHEVNMPLSLIPILSSVWFGSLGVFLLTSCAAFAFDGIFVIMQRYNRPRLLRLLTARRKQKNGLQK